MRLSPTAHDAVLHVVKPPPDDAGWWWWALRPAAARGGGGAAPSECGGHDALSEACRRLGVAVTAPALWVHAVSRVAVPPAALRSLPAAELRCVVPSGKSLHLDATPPATPAASDGGGGGGGDGFATCAVTLGVDAERLGSLLAERLPPLLRAGAGVVATVLLPREGGTKAAGSTLSRLTARLEHAGYRDVQLQWLFANAPSERTLCAVWSRSGTSR